MQKIRPAKRATLHYRHIDVEVDEQTVARARRHIRKLPIGTLGNVRCALVLSLDAAISGLEEVEPPVDAMDAFRIDLIFLRALDECLLDCEDDSGCITRAEIAIGGGQSVKAVYS